MNDFNLPLNNKLILKYELNNGIALAAIDISFKSRRYAAFAFGSLKNMVFTECKR